MFKHVSNLEALLTVGTIGMFICMIYRRKKYSLSVLKCAVLTLILTAVGVLGAKLLFALENGFLAWDGVSFFGSVFLIPCLMPLFGRLLRQKPGATTDLCAPCVAIMIACLRISCALSGCCGGWTMCLGGLCFSWPTQMMDSIGDLLILIWLLKKEDNKEYVGTLYPLFMVFYSIMRFFLEFLRDTPKDWLLLSHGQWFSLGALLTGLAWLYINRSRQSVCSKS